MSCALYHTGTAHLQQSTLMPHLRDLSVQHLMQTPTECLCLLSTMPNESDTSVEVCLSELTNYSAKARVATRGLSRICFLLEILELEQQYLGGFIDSTADLF